jgi:miniconductance mechanosensitive channel
MEFIFDCIQGWLTSAGVRPSLAQVTSSALTAAAAAIGALALCSVMAVLLRRFVTARCVRPEHRQKAAVFVRSSVWFAFAWMMCAYLPDAFGPYPSVAGFASRALDVAAIVLFAASVSSALTCLRVAAKARFEGQVLASKTFSQMMKILVWFTAAVVSAAVMMGKSPAFVLSGLGALTAVLMLIFRDSLLGLVAGVQVSQNDMVRVGDWITMPKYNADGNVVDIALTTVKVRNFDNTVTMIPSSALISDSFVNWRYMSTSKGRRIKRPVWISVSSVRELTGRQFEQLVDQGLLRAEDRPVSNLAAFEIWLRRMLAADENITQELTCMVRQTEAGDTGIPVEVYAFTKTRDWEEYERIQTDIFDRIFVTVPRFGLVVYQRTGDNRRPDAAEGASPF